MRGVRWPQTLSRFLNCKSWMYHVNLEGKNQIQHRPYTFQQDLFSSLYLEFAQVRDILILIAI
jgi:hypothetical protein